MFGLEKVGKQYNPMIGYVINFLGSLSFYIPIWSFFLSDFLGFSFAQASIIIVISMLTSMIFEIPSGTWADLYGRKKTLLAGTIIVIITTSTFLRAQNFWIYIINELIRGVGGAMMSGCLTAIIYDWYKKEGREEAFTKYARIENSLRFGGRVVAFALAGWLFSQNPYYPYICLLFAQIVMLGVTLLLNDTHKTISIVSGNILHSTFVSIKKGRKEFTRADEGILARIILLFSCGYIICTTLWNAYQPLLDSLKISITVIGLVYCIASLLSVLGSRMTKYFNHEGKRPFLVLQCFVGVILVTGLCLFLPGYRKLLGLAFIQITFGRYRPIIKVYLNNNAGSEKRATINSIVSLITSGEVLLGGMLAGVLVDYIGLSSVYFLTFFGGIVLSCVVWMFRKKVG